MQEKIKKYLNNIISAILSLILVFFIWHKFLATGNTFIFVILFVAFYKYINFIVEQQNKRKCIVSCVLAIMFAIIEVICFSINYDYTLNHVIDKWLVLNITGYAILAWSIISFIYGILEKNNFKNEFEKIRKNMFFSNIKKNWILYAVLIFLAWLPYFLRYFPGLLTADSCAQVSQAIGLSSLTNHHPIVHTGIISLFVNIGRTITGNINIGVALYTLFQMLTMSIIFGKIIMYLKKKQVPAIIRLLALLYYMFYPVNALFCVTMWKDILFAGIIPIYIIQKIEILFNTDEVLKSKKKISIYIIISILAMFLRNNGLYLVVLTLPFVIIVLRKYWKKVLSISVIILVMYFAIKTSIFGVFNVKEGSVGEMLSIPLQQIARVEKYHNEELDIETLSKINKFFKCSDIGEKYNPVLSDPVKAELNIDYFESNKGEFISLWLKLLKPYFKDYVESFISNSYGYYYPEAMHWVANRTMEQNNLGIEQHPLLEGKLVSRVDSLIEKRDIPILSMFFSIGFAFWLTVISLGYEIYKKNYKCIPVYIIIFVLWLTIVASPVFCEYRYAYPLFTSLPLYFGYNFIKKEKNI